MQWFMLVISTLSLVLIAITLMYRAVELKDKGLRWNVRRLGLILTAFAPVGILAHEWARHDWPDVYTVSFRFGLLLVFMTTPYLPPWHRWLWKGLHGEGPL